jgi:DNA-binding GntR family transcriptional regulator
LGGHEVGPTIGLLCRTLMDTSARKDGSGMARRRVGGRGRGADKTTRTEEILHHLENEILGGRLKPGEKLDETSLAERFDVSRTPIREVLRHLASSGLVQVRPHHGAVVRQFTLPELVEMFQVMAEMEGLSARLAARRMTPQERQLMRTCNEACAAAAQSGDEIRFFAENAKFHEAISNASRNSFLISQQRSLGRLLDPYRWYVTHQPGRMEESIVEHEEIIRAIESGDPTVAGDKMRFHVNVVGEEAGDFITMLTGINGPSTAKPEK